MKPKTVWAIAAIAGLACLDPFWAPPADAVPFAPPSDYRAYWAAVEDCSGLTGDFDKIRWFRVPGAAFACADYPTTGCAGRWMRPHDIYLAGSQPYIVVAHEMLHDLLQRGSHPEVFRTCGLMN